MRYDGKKRKTRGKKEGGVEIKGQTKERGEGR